VKRRAQHPSCPASCRASTSYFVAATKTWMAGTSPAMTTRVPSVSGIVIRRRAFITLLAGTAVAWPLAAMAQQGERMRRVGMLMPYEQADPEAQARNAAIREVLKELGWSEGRNVEYHFRWAGNDAARLRTSAADLVGLRPDVILAPSTIATEALRQATSAIPIVFVNVLDPVGSGFVASLARPGGNVTGFATVEPSIGGKWLELLIAIAPATKQVAILFSARSFSMAPVGPLAQTFDTAAPVFPALKLIRAPVQDIAELDSVIAAHGGMLGNGLIVAPEPFTSNHYEAITALAARYRLPAVYPYRFFAASGGLLSYGIDLVTQYRQAGTYVDRILKGAKPGDLPVQLPTKFELVINLKTAKALGIEVPPTLLARADEVIE
jgi:putative ABC transport system substrate-binding protein